jgi:hypothetical protein
LEFCTASNIDQSPHRFLCGRIDHMQSLVRSERSMEDDRALYDELVGAASLDDVIPKLARDRDAIRRVESNVRGRDTTHDLIHGDARAASALEVDSVHLVITSPPYWTLKRYNEHEQQLGHMVDYNEFIAQLDEVWANCYRGLVPGGRLIMVLAIAVKP